MYVFLVSRFTLKVRKSSFLTAVLSQPLLPHAKVDNVMDQAEWIEKMRNTEDGSFIYMTYAVPKTSEYYSPYALR